MTYFLKKLPYPIVTLALLSACSAVGPNYVKPDVQAPNKWTNAQTFETSRAEMRDLSHWWQQLGDTMLSSLVEEALLNSPDIHNAQAKLREVRARSDLADDNRYPTVTASGSASRNKSSTNTGSGARSNLFKAGFDASWEPDIFGGQRRATEAAEADLGASQASLHDTQVTLVAEVALNYIQLRSYQARLTIAHDNLATQQQTLQITDWREQAGLATSLDVEQARTNMAQTKSTIPTLNTSLTKSENRLAILLGKSPGALHDLLIAPTALPTVPEYLAVGIPADTLRQRPDVRAAERKLAAETARVGQKTATLYPSFSLSGSFGWSSLTLGALGGAGTTVSSLIGSMTQSIFDAGRTRSNIKIQHAIQEQALVGYEQSVLTALEDVENALTSCANNRQQQAALNQAAQASRNAALLAKLRYESGLVDFQKVLDTERTRLSAEDSLASAQADGLASLISLYKALGGGWSEVPTPDIRTKVIIESKQS